MANKSWILTTLRNIFYVEVTKITCYSICACLFFLLVSYFLIKYDRNKLLRRGFPGLKLAWYNVIGHVSFVPHGPRFDQLYSTNTYFLRFISGMSTLFRNESLFYIWILNQRRIILHKADVFEELLKSTDKLEKADEYLKMHEWLGTGLLTSEGLKWKSRRKILTPSFHFDILKDFLPILNENSKILVEILAEATSEEWIDIHKPLTLCSLDIICETTLGVHINAQRNQDSEYVQTICRVSTMTMERMSNPKIMFDFIFFLTGAGKQYKEDIKNLHCFTRNIIKKKKNELLQLKAYSNQNESQTKRKALMDLLLYHCIDSQDFSEEDIREEVDTFAFAGHDTTSAGLSWSLYLIGLYPEVQKKIHDELDKIFDGDDRFITNDDLRDLKYLECVIKEAQRLYPSVPIIGRKINKDVNLCGFTIQSGAECWLFINGLHRDPNVFSNPEVFDPERFFSKNATGRNPYAYVPFSAGPRNCIGQRFAMMELKVVLASVLRCYSVLSLEHRDKLLPMADLISQPSLPMKMKIIPRKEIEG